MIKMEYKKMIAAFILALSTSVAEAQLLKGTLKGFTADDDGVQIAYTPTGGVLNMTYSDVTVKPDGTFTYDGKLSPRNNDVQIYLRGKVFGAHLIPGKTVEATFTMDRDSTIHVAFSGPDAQVSKVVNAMSLGYDLMFYCPVDDSESLGYDRYRTILDEKHAAMTPLINRIKDKKLRLYYADYNEAQYKFIQIELLMDKCHKDSTRYQDNGAFKKLIADVDINSDIAYRSMLGYMKVSSMVMKPMNYGGDMGDYCRELMSLCDRYVTNPLLRSDIVKSLAQNYFAYGGNTGDYHKFYADATQWAGADSTAFAAYKDKIASWDQTQSGTKAYDITLTDPDGHNVKLSDIAKGRMTYIDVWATWCGPCKKEIPHLAELVEKYKGNDKVQFISISIDEDVNAWKRMISRDKPAWAQYNIHGGTSDTFSKQWGITGIPRFLMIDKNGNILNADAPRPSEEKTTEIIDSL